MRRSRILVAAAVMAVTLTGGLAVASRHDTASAATIWADEFNGAAGTGVDTSKWNFDTGGGGWGNNELETYTNSTSNVYQDGQGHLVIDARKNNGQWTSGRIQTSGKFNHAYGHVEARIQVPNGSGLWPAFWMLGGGNWPTDGEIDIMEVVGRDPNRLFGTLHGPGYSGGNGFGNNIVAGSPWYQAFHNYAVDWSANLIVWTVDGQEYFRATTALLRQAKNNNSLQWVYDHPFFIILNLAVGGNFGQGDTGSLPPESKMLIDYVHVTDSSTPPTGGPTGNPPTGSTSALKGAGSGRCIDVPGANSANGTRLAIFDCNGTGAQQWTLATDGTARALGKCMDAAAAGTANGTAVQLYDCNGTGAQKFTLSAAGDLVNSASGKCVDVANNATANSSPLQLWTCGGSPNQKWSKA